MKKLITLGLLTFLISTTFLSDNPPGWYQQLLPLTNTVTDISFVDSLRGWVITERNGGDAYILHTTNGGNNWTIQFQQVLLLTSIQFLDSNIGYVVGSQPPGVILKTTNGGTNWNLSTISPYPLRDVKFINPDTGWICSDDKFEGGVFKTTNGGENWHRQTGAFDAPMKLFFLNKDTGWSLSTASLYKTTNSGVNWSKVSSDFIGLRNLFFLNNDTGWIVRQAGQNSIIKTTNGGVNWFVQLDPIPFGSGPNDIKMYNNSKGWIAASRFTILSLANDSTWGKQAVPSGFPVFNSIYMIDTIIGYSGGTIFVKTEDGGGIITNVNHSSEDIPSSFQLFQNYPNPFNPNTFISYELRNIGNIKLSIYDILGREIQVLVDQKQTAGSYEVNFDGTNFTSGVYFYVLKNDNQVISKKMILSK